MQVLNNGRTLYDVFQEMQQAVPVQAGLGTFFLFAAVLCPLGIVMGSIPLPRNGWPLAFLGGGGGFLLGILLSVLSYRRLPRRLDVVSIAFDPRAVDTVSTVTLLLRARLLK
jgi:hypothetical protein